MGPLLSAEKPKPKTSRKTMGRKPRPFQIIIVILSFQGVCFVWRMPPGSTSAVADESGKPKLTAVRHANVINLGKAYYGGLEKLKKMRPTNCDCMASAAEPG
jgi:hypothetical protein